MSILTNARNPPAFHTSVGLARPKMMTRYVGEYTRLPRTRQTVNTDDGFRGGSVDRLPGNGAIRGVEIIEKWIDPVAIAKCKP